MHVGSASIVMYGMRNTTAAGRGKRGQAGGIDSEASPSIGLQNLG